VRTDFDELKKEFDDQCQALSGRINVNLQSNWHDIEDLLVGPFIDPSRRASLVENSRSISDTFNKSSRQPAVPPGNPYREAQRQGRMATAVLGERCLNEDRSGSQISFEKLRENMEQAAQDENWEKALNQAGEQVGRRWRDLAERIRKE